MTKIKTLLAGLLLAASGLASAQNVVKISVPTINDGFVPWVDTFKKEVEANTKGALKVDAYYGGQLGSIQASLNGVLTNTMQITFALPGFFVSAEPRLMVLEAGGVFDNMEHAQRVLDDSASRRVINSWMTDKPAFVLTVWTFAPTSIAMCKPITAVKELDGLRLRIPPSHMLNDVWKQYGITSVSTNTAEVPMAMSTGAIKGSLTSPGIALAQKYYDIRDCQTLFIVPGLYNNAVGLVSRTWFDSLTAEQKKIVLDATKKAEAAASKYAREDLGRTLDAWVKAGGRVFQPAPADRDLFIATTTRIQQGVLDKNPVVKADYDVFGVAAQRYRK
jgi:TRAP-type C4-dicarboxylate transport system substrate-binding protein